MYWKSNRGGFLAVACVFLALAIAGLFIFQFPRTPEISSVTENSADQTGEPHSLTPDFGKLPLSFEENVGQTDQQVRYLSRGHGIALFLTDKEAVLSLGKVPAEKPANSTA